MDPDAASPRREWFWLTYLTALNVLNMVDRHLISSFGPAIRKDLDLDLSQIGVLTGLAFVVFYSIVGIWLGTAADRWSRPRLIAGGLFIWSLMTAASGFSRSFYELGVARLLVGVGEAALTPAAVSLLSDVFPARRRSLAAGIYYLGVPIGMGLSMSAAGLLGPVLGGWRPCFWLIGGIGIPMAILTGVARDPRRYGNPGSEDGTATNGFWNTLQIIRKSKSTILTLLGGAAILFSVGTIFFDTIWLNDERGFSQSGGAASFLGLSFVIGGTTGTLVGGWLGDRWQRHRKNGRLLFLAFGQAVAIPASLAFRNIDPNNRLFFLVAIGNAIAQTFFYGPLFACVCDQVPVRCRSSATAILILVINLFGLAPGAFFAGRLADSFAIQAYPDPTTKALCVTSLVGLAAVPMLLLAAIDQKRLVPAQGIHA